MTLASAVADMTATIALMTLSVGCAQRPNGASGEEVEAAVQRAEQELAATKAHSTLEPQVASKK